MGRRIRGLALVLALVASPASAELRGLAVAARVNHDVGTIFVSGTEKGPGGGVALRLSFGDDDVRWEPEVAIDVAGFSGEGDGDPIFMGTLILARKSYFGYGGRAGARTWWSLGAGAGALAIGGGGAVFPARIALGVTLAPDSDFGLELSAFNRFALTSTGGDPSTEYINSTGVELAVRFGR
jgi:hypothetical protein